MQQQHRAEQTSERARLMCFSIEAGSPKNGVVGGDGKKKQDGYLYNQASLSSVSKRNGGRKANMSGQLLSAEQASERSLKHLLSYCK